MKITVSKNSARLAAAGLLLCLSLGATAQSTIPKKPITLVVGFAAGGSSDYAARLIARKLGENIGQPVIIDNRSGAGGNIAHQYVANAVADGSVLLFGSVGPLTVAPHLMKIYYDPVRDLAPVAGGVNFPNILVVNKGLGVKNIAEFVALSKKSPGSVDFGSTGPGSASHLAGELFNQRAGIRMVHIPYKGGAPALQDVLGGRIASLFASPPTVMPHVSTGNLVALATTGAERSAEFPSLPTIAESGYPGVVALNWYAFVAPSKTPGPILDRWSEEITRVLNDRDVKEALIQHGMTPQPLTRTGLAAFMKSESEKWSKVIKDGNIRMD